MHVNKASNNNIIKHFLIRELIETQRCMKANQTKDIIFNKMTIVQQKGCMEFVSTIIVLE